MPQRGRSTRNGDEMGFHTAIDLASQGSLFGIVAAERRREALPHKALFDADDGAGTDVQRFGDLATGGRLLVAFVGFEQHAGGHLLMGRGFASTNEVMQLLLLLCAEMDGVAFFVHGWSLLWLFPQFRIFSLLCQI